MFNLFRFSFQAKVFGAGYPSIPTMTQEEYLEKEIREGKVVLEYDTYVIQIPCHMWHTKMVNGNFEK